MTKHELIDNFLSEEEFRPIYNIFMGMQIAWNCYDGIVMPGDGKIQFVHPLYCDFAPSSLYWRDLQPIFDKLDPVIKQNQGQLQSSLKDFFNKNKNKRVKN